MTTTAAPPLLRLQGVTKRFSQAGNDVVALSDLSLSVSEREFVVIVGPSGCGKSTLLKVVADLLPVTEGVITRDAGLKHPGGIGMVFQTPVLLPWRNVLKNVLLPTELLRIRQAESRARKLLAEVGLEEFEGALPYQLSGGMQQRVAICRALLPDPKLLLMDEPFGALDAITRERLNLQLQEIWEKTHKTILLVTHSIEEAVFLSDRIVVMTPRPGRVAEIIDNELPRPRSVATYHDALFSDYAARIREIIVGDA